MRRALEPYLEAGGGMIHLRILASEETSKKALDLLCAEGSVCNVIHLPGVGEKPKGDVILADVAREDASVVIHDLKELKIPEEGSITLDFVDTQLSDGARRAEEHAPGFPSDAVVWEEVESRTEEQTELGAGFLAFMVLACLIACGGDPHRPAHPDRGRDGGRPRVRAARRAWPWRWSRSSAGSRSARSSPWRWASPWAPWRRCWPRSRSGRSA